MTITFLACKNKSTFDLYFIPDLQHQSCRRSLLFSRYYIWTIQITQSMLGAPGPLVTITTYSKILIQIVAYIWQCFFLPCKDFQIVPCHMLMPAVTTWPSSEDLDLHYSGMLWSFTMEWTRDMLYNHGMNSLGIVISHTVMRSPSITGPTTQNGKLSSGAKKIGIIKFILCTLTCLYFLISSTISLFHFQH